MADDKLPVEKEVIIATESAGGGQKQLGRPMLMLLILIGVALAGIGIMVATMSN